MRPLRSRERMLETLRYREADHVPLLFKSFGFRPPAHLEWSDEVEEARCWLSLGADAWIDVGPPLGFLPGVEVRQLDEAPQDDPWPVMIKEYDTPAGTLRQEVFRTDDWVSHDWPTHKGGSADVQLFDDYNVPRYRRCPIECEQDIEKLRYLIHPLSDAEVEGFRESIAVAARQAEDLGVLLVGHGSNGTDAAMWICGAHSLVLMAIERPELFGALLDVIHERDKRNVEVLMETPVDLIMRRGYYEGASFWSPDLYRAFFAPRVKELTDIVHQADRLIGYTMSVGVMPLLDILAEIGYDAHHLLDPISQGTRVDLGKVKAAFNDKTAVVGGLNAPVTLERGTREEIRREVFDAVRLLGPGGGLALTPAEAIFASTPWESIETVIEAWKEVR